MELWITDATQLDRACSHPDGAVALALSARKVVNR